MNVQQVWQSQATEAPRISLAFVRHGASALERRTRWRNALEYGTGVFAGGMAVLVAWQKTSGRPLLLAALICMAVWAVYYMIRWHQLASVVARPEEAGVLDTLRYQRKHLERQRDARRRAWRWLFLPVLPVFALFIASEIVEVNPVSWTKVASLVGWVIVGGGIGAWHSKCEERRFQREIDALDSLANPDTGPS